MFSEYLPILFIVLFVAYPFAIVAAARWIAQATKRTTYVRETVTVFAVLGIAIVVYSIAAYGWGKYVQVTVLGSAVFVFCLAATGAFLATLANALMPSSSVFASEEEE